MESEKNISMKFKHSELLSIHLSTGNIMVDNANLCYQMPGCKESSLRCVNPQFSF